MDGASRVPAATGRLLTSRRALTGENQASPIMPTSGPARTRSIRNAPDYKIPCQLYNLDCVAYESLLLGLFTIWRGQPGPREKPNEVCVGFSRDGFSWSRPDRRPFCPVSETPGDWNYSNVQSAGGCCLIVGDRLYFYVSGRGKGQVTSLATLRRDGFASLDADGKGGTLTTRPVLFSGKHLFVNADVDAGTGELRAEILDESGQLIPPFSRTNSIPVRADKTLQAIRWEGATDLSAATARPVKIRFLLKNGKLYSFWVSPDESGAVMATSRPVAPDSSARPTR